jgi:hypothetical protein
MINFAKGSTLPIINYERGPAQVPLKWDVNTTEPLPPFGFIVDGNGHPDAIPPAIIAILFGAQYSYDLTISGNGLSVSFQGNFTRGESVQIFEGDRQVVDGTVPIESIAEIASFAVRTEGGDITLKPDVTTVSSSKARVDGGTETLVITWANFSSDITYFPTEDKWVMGEMSQSRLLASIFLQMAVDNGLGGDDLEFVFASISGPNTAELEVDNSITICGAPVFALVSDGTVVSGSIDVTAWLPDF